jgi:hypothetical protein
MLDARIDDMAKGLDTYHELDAWRRSEGLSWDEAAARLDVKPAQIEALKTALWTTKTMDKVQSALGKPRQTDAMTPPKGSLPRPGSLYSRQHTQAAKLSNESLGRAERARNRSPF